MTPHEKFRRNVRNLEGLLLLIGILGALAQAKLSSIRKTADAAIKNERGESDRLREQFDGALEHIHAKGAEVDGEPPAA